MRERTQGLAIHCCGYGHLGDGQWKAVLEGERGREKERERVHLRISKHTYMCGQSPPYCFAKVSR